MVMIFFTKILNFLKKIDPKTAIISLLLLFTLFFGYKWYFSDNNKSIIDTLHKENAKLESERKLIALELDSMKNKNAYLIIEREKIETKIIEVSNLIDKYKREGIKSKADLENFKKSMDKINNDIENLVKNPKNKQDEELLNSLRNHFKEREKIYKEI